MIPDLSLVSIGDLIKEIFSRFDAAIVAYEMFGVREHQAVFDYHGGHSTCIGLCERFKWKFANHDRENFEHQPEIEGPDTEGL